MGTADEIQVLIVGGGLAGLSLAGFLRRAGMDPVVVERDRSLWDPSGPLTLGPDELTMLSWLDVAAEVRADGASVDEWSIRGPDDAIETSLEADGGAGLVAVPYSALRERLRSTLPPASVRTATTLRGLAQENGCVVAEFDHDVREQFDVVVGADGVRSTVRQCVDHTDPTFCGTASWAFPLDPDVAPMVAGEVWTGDGAVVSLIPTGEGSIGWLSLPTDAPGHGTDDLDAVADRIHDFEFLGHESLSNRDPTFVWAADDYRVETDRWRRRRVALIGDAAHGRHRLTGVGPLLALEDAAVLASALTDQTDPVETRLEHFAEQRRGRLRTMVDHAGSRSVLDDLDVPCPDRCPNLLALRSARLEACFAGQPSTPAVSEPPQD